MKKDDNTDEFSFSLEGGERFMASPRRRSLVARSLSMTVLTQSTEDPDIKKPETRRHSLTGHSPNRKLDIVRLKINQNTAALNKKLAQSLTKLTTDHEVLRLLLKNYATLVEPMIASRNKLSLKLREQLDVFIYQNQPPALVYLYCAALIKVESALDCTKSEWLINLMKRSSGAMAHTLIYIATFLELSQRNVNEELCFREDTLSNLFSVCYAKTSANLNTLVTNIVVLIRKLPNWPNGYNIDKSEVTESVLQNFTDMIIAICELVKKMPYDPVFAAIMTLRYDMILTHYGYQPQVALLQANSLFWLRLFAPDFRLQLYTIEEEPIIKRITVLFVKASSNRLFNSGQENGLNNYLNSIIETHLNSAMSHCFEDIAATQTDISIFKFKNNHWGLWDTLLISNSVEENVARLSSL